MKNSNWLLTAPTLALGIGLSFSAYADVTPSNDQIKDGVVSLIECLRDKFPAVPDSPSLSSWILNQEPITIVTTRDRGRVLNYYGPKKSISISVHIKGTYTSFQMVEFDGSNLDDRDGFTALVDELYANHCSDYVPKN